EKAAATGFLGFQLVAAGKIRSFTPEQVKGHLLEAARQHPHKFVMALSRVLFSMQLTNSQTGAALTDLQVQQLSRDLLRSLISHYRHMQTQVNFPPEFRDLAAISNDRFMVLSAGIRELRTAYIIMSEQAYPDNDESAFQLYERLINLMGQVTATSEGPVTASMRAIYGDEYEAPLIPVLASANSDGNEQHRRIFPLFAHHLGEYFSGQLFSGQVNPQVLEEGTVIRWLPSLSVVGDDLEITGPDYEAVNTLTNYPVRQQAGGNESKEGKMQSKGTGGGKNPQTTYETGKPPPAPGRNTSSGGDGNDKEEINRCLVCGKTIDATISSSHCVSSQSEGEPVEPGQSNVEIIDSKKLESSDAYCRDAEIKMTKKRPLTSSAMAQTSGGKTMKVEHPASTVADRPDPRDKPMLVGSESSKHLSVNKSEQDYTQNAFDNSKRVVGENNSSLMDTPLNLQDSDIKMRNIIYALEKSFLPRELKVLCEWLKIPEDKIGTFTRFIDLYAYYFQNSDKILTLNIIMEGLSNIGLSYLTEQIFSMISNQEKNTGPINTKWNTQLLHMLDKPVSYLNSIQCEERFIDILQSTTKGVNPYCRFNFERYARFCKFLFFSTCKPNSVFNHDVFNNIDLLSSEKTKIINQIKESSMPLRPIFELVKLFHFTQTLVLDKWAKKHYIIENHLNKSDLVCTDFKFIKGEEIDWIHSFERYSVASHLEPEITAQLKDYTFTSVSPFWAACSKGFQEAAKILYGGGSVDLDETPVDCLNVPDRITPLMIAVEFKHLNIIKFLLDSGANTELKDASGRSVDDFNKSFHLNSDKEAHDCIQKMLREHRPRTRMWMLWIISAQAMTSL
ncbi:ankyrin repeat domain-containing protein, partial [Endozoicomonas sp.]|uniref:ankyrin repeat domain-containing protein n=1 Tax=Endozoicomonas sp. TaxID=1892382 RepID=UPI00383A817D